MFNSCVTRPRIKDKERCTASFKFNLCVCAPYSLMRAKRSGRELIHPIEYCDDITGFHAEAWKKDITPWARENIRAYNDGRD